MKIISALIVSFAFIQIACSQAPSIIKNVKVMDFEKYDPPSTLVVPGITDSRKISIYRCPQPSLE